ncbi:hypothetical protein [uncultured Chryseobacterium sp.]|uniref:hypothetical protein n=1 Tax=uncultured Chryseobacterium sp. TaxID=259322 RepID=UPI0025F9E55D|nr:hypothetical protein [uncultured Chryseobacterium sp.]
MTKKLISWLAFTMAFCLLLLSCVHDEIYTASDPASKEYHSKSLWKEDATFIKNVMKIYSEHEYAIRKTDGNPVWDYAMSMGKYDETFMAVPIVKNDKVINTLVCGRFGKKVYFRYENSEMNNDFFQDIMFGKYSRYNTEPKENSSVNHKGIICTTQSVSMWYPNSETNPDAGGHWETSYYNNCYSFQDYANPGWENGGYDYGGSNGGGSTDPNNQQSEDPCQKTKSIINNPQVKASIDDLKTKSTGTLENAYKFKADGTPSNLIVGNAHTVNFGDKTGYQGGYHNHTTGIPMLAPADIEQLLQFALAQGNYGNSSAAYVGMVAPNDVHYIIQFNGNYDDALVTFSQQDLDEFKIKYQEINEIMLLDSQYSIDHIKLNTNGIEILFFDILKKMGLYGKVNLQRIDKSGVIKNINLDQNNQSISTDC